ncbi:MAG: hypothetical protein M3P33_02155 [bacterium]|nr:hypothetical protein [bacterium]
MTFEDLYTTKDLTDAYINFYQTLNLDTNKFYIPESIKDSVRKYQRQSASAKISKSDIPKDFIISYRIAELIYQEKTALASQQLSVWMNRQQQAPSLSGHEVALTYLPQKIELLKENLQNLYSAKKVNPQTASYLNSLLLILENTNQDSLATHL